MKILFDLRVLSGEWSGIAAYTYNLLKAISKYNPKHEIILLYREKSCLEKMPAALFKSIILEADIYNLKNIYYLNKIIIQEKIDIYLTTQYFWPFGMLAAKTISMIHDIIPLTHPDLLAGSKKTKFSFLFKLSTYFSLKFSRRIIVNSEATLETLKKYFGATLVKNCRKLYPAIFPKLINQNKTILNKFGINGEYLLYVGRHDAYKNLINLIKAFELLIKDGYKGKLVIAGKIDKRYPEAYDYAKNNNLVIFTNFVTQEEIDVLYSNCTFVLQPSFAEGFGFTSIEPYQYNKIALVSNIESHREILNEPSFFFDPKDPQNIKTSIEKALKLNNQELKELLDKAQERLNIFSSEKIAEEFSKIIDQSLLS